MRLLLFLLLAGCARWSDFAADQDALHGPCRAPCVEALGTEEVAVYFDFEAGICTCWAPFDRRIPMEQLQLPRRRFNFRPVG